MEKPTKCCITSPDRHRWPAVQRTQAAQPDQQPCARRRRGSGFLARDPRRATEGRLAGGFQLDLSLTLTLNDWFGSNQVVRERGNENKSSSVFPSRDTRDTKCLRAVGKGGRDQARFGPTAGNNSRAASVGAGNRRWPPVGAKRSKESDRLLSQRSRNSNKGTAERCQGSPRRA